jgi:hypothetical protein
MADAKKEIPPVQNGWDKNEDGDRSLASTPSLFKDANHVYVYSEKQLDNVTIGITDMQGNTYHYEVTTVPVCTYYAVSIESLPRDSTIFVFIKEAIILLAYSLNNQSKRMKNDEIWLFL